MGKDLPSQEDEINEDEASNLAEEAEEFADDSNTNTDYKGD